MGAANSVLGAATGNTSSSASYGSNQQLSGTQLQKIDSGLTVQSSNTQLKQAVTEAKPNIRQFLSIAACQIHNTNASQIKGVSHLIATGTWKYAVAPLNRGEILQAHPDGKCMEVSRIYGWKMEAQKSFSFKVLFVSPYSDQTTERKAVWIKEDDNVWRISSF